MRSAFAALLAMSVAACVAPAGYHHAGAPDVPVVPENAADALARQAHRVDAPPAASDDDMLRAFLADARAKGAAAVSSVSLHDTAERAGATVTCRRDFVPYASTETGIVPRMTPPTPETRVVMRSVSRMEPRTESRCGTVVRPVTRTETAWTTQYDPISRSTRSAPQTRTVTHMESSVECRPVTTMEMVTRIEPVVETTMAPPRLEWIPVTHVEWRLAQEPPRCTDAAGAAPSRWVEGLLHVPAPPAAPAAAPSPSQR